METDDADGRPGARRRRLPAPLLACLLLLAHLPAAAQGLDEPLRTGSAAHVEAAYLVNFLRFSEWPAEAPAAGAPLVISVVGSERSADVVAEVAAAAGPLAGRPVLVQDVDFRSRRAAGSAAQQRAIDKLRGSHLVFVDESAGREAAAVLEQLQGLPVLTVGNGEGFLDLGGMLQLLPAGRNIVFAANADAIQRSGVLLSAKVLKLARQVEGMP